MPDWNEIKTKYISSGQSTASLAREYGVHIRTVQRYVKNGGWKELKAENDNKLTAKALTMVTDQKAQRLTRLMEATTKAVDVALEAFEDKQQFKRYLVTENDALTEKICEKVDARALKQFTGSLKDLTALMRDFYDLPTPAQAEERRLAAEKLELEKRRLNADAAGQTLTVRFEDTEGAES